MASMQTILRVGTIGILGAAFLSGTAVASTPETRPQSLTTMHSPSPSLLNSGLLDFSRLDISHSLSYSFSSSSHGSYSGGLWVTGIGYQISNPLRVSMDVGMLIDSNGDGPVVSEKNIFLRGFNLDYQPSKTFRLHIAYTNQPPNAALGYHYPGYGLGYRSWGSPLGLDR
jgi:hypothetical protein